MRIRIKKNAAEVYLHKTHPAQVNAEWLRKLRLVANKELEVDTKFLFKDQFNTVPVEGVSPSGMRIMEYLVSKIIDDERPGKARCNWCGKVSENTNVCEHCGKFEYLDVFSGSDTTQSKSRGTGKKILVTLENHKIAVYLGEGVDKETAIDILEEAILDLNSRDEEDDTDEQ